jgi:hypothetical protein
MLDMVSREQAMHEVEKRINAFDPDWPTKPKQVVFDAMTREEADGWLFFYGIPDDMRVPGRDPEPEDNPPWHVNRETGEASLRESD